MYIIVGLGNPGNEYKNTCHNMGFRVIDELSNKFGIAVEKNKCKALVGEGIIAGQKCVLVKPQTYMNLSGESVQQLISWYKPDMDKLIVAYDDIDLPAGKLRFRADGSAGTHNGMRNIIALTGCTEFPRVRVGIGRPPEHMDLADYVLTKPRGEAAEAIDGVIKKAAEAVEKYIGEGLESVRRFVGK